MKIKLVKAVLVKAVLMIHGGLLQGQSSSAPPQFLGSQTSPPMPIQAHAPGVPSTPIPKHLVYAHFLAMVNEFDKRATAAADPDPYKFAQPFARAGLENVDLDSLLKEAKALTAELTVQDEKAKTFVAAYRERAKIALQQGQPLPPLPAELHQLQAERTAVSVNHMFTLQSALGKEKTARLEAYFAREVTPHVSLKVLAHPPAAADVPSGAQGLAVQQ